MYRTVLSLVAITLPSDPAKLEQSQGDTNTGTGSLSVAPPSKKNRSFLPLSRYGTCCQRVSSWPSPGAFQDLDPGISSRPTIYIWRWKQNMFYQFLICRYQRGLSQIVDCSFTSVWHLTTEENLPSASDNSFVMKLRIWNYMQHIFQNYSILINISYWSYSPERKNKDFPIETLPLGLPCRIEERG